MTSTLKQFIELDNTLDAALYLAKLFNPTIELSGYHQLVADLVSDCQVNQDSHTLQDFKQLVRCFYAEQLFTSGNAASLNSDLCLVDKVLDYRSGLSVSIAIIFENIANQLGFNVKGINFPGHYLLCLQLGQQRRYFIDPLNGRFLNYQQVCALYTLITGEEEMEPEQLDTADTHTTIVRLLTNLKAAFMDEQRFAQALQCVDLLIELCPDDPYERRDRGFLLHQLQCFKVALADYQYFIRQCPSDPAAQLLKLQLRHLEPLPVVLH